MSLVNQISLGIATLQAARRSNIAVPTGQSNVIPADAPSVFEQLQSLSVSDPKSYNAIVRPNNPPPGIGGFLFDIPGDDEARLKSVITKHFVENNTPISDHIALEPETVIVRGLVAELVATIPDQSPVEQIGDILPLLGVMTPPLTPAQAFAQGQAAASLAIQTQARASQQSIYQYYLSTAPSQANLTRQSSAALYFQQAWWGRQIFSVETPWGIWTNMAIAEVRMLQTKDSKYISDFAITFERIRVAGDITVNLGQLTGRNVFQQAPTASNGNAGLVSPTSAQAAAAAAHFTPPPD